MSQITAATGLLDALKQDAIDAWGLTNKSVEYGVPRLPSSVKPRCAIALQPVTMDWKGARGIEQVYTFIIAGTFDFPAGGTNILLGQIARANELIAAIITGPDYSFGAGAGDKAYLPIIRDVSFFEEDDPQRRSYEVAVTFECRVQMEHFPGAFGG